MHRTIVKITIMSIFFSSFLLMLLVDRGVVDIMTLNESMILFGVSFVILVLGTWYLIKTSKLKSGIDHLNRELEAKAKLEE